MKAKKIIYSKLISTGNFSNIKAEIEIEVEDGEKASYVFEKAKEFVNRKLGNLSEAEKQQKIYDCNDIPF